MDLDALIDQLNTVEPKSINWKALADSTSSGETATPSDQPITQAEPTWVIEASRLARLQVHLGPLSAEEQRTRITAILHEALDNWLQAHQA